ncbi:transglutaminase-like cysteine peptidase [Pseudooceanicola sp. LIPI14-2-Ac024]|uniref:transglutaminase-like cysteine peptidase n=1 Tax=Pseudooceanicola sp. LIPI14-2-Ac024 TaxID=3344875 RepID=UPI0035D0767E
MGNGLTDRFTKSPFRRPFTALARLAALSALLAAALPQDAALAKQSSSYLTPVRHVVAPQGARNLCSTIIWACSVSAGTPSIAQADISRIHTLNRTVNRKVRSVSDASQFRVEEEWSLPTARGGDCEDFALLKKRELIRLGYPAQNLLIATVLDHRRRGHAVLVVRTEVGDMVLDNLTNRIKSWSDTGYIFLRMQDPRMPSKWVMVSPT